MIEKKGKKFKLVISSKRKISRRQEAPTCFDLTTVCYVFKPSYILKNRNLLLGKVGFIEIPKERAIDIDDKIDYKVALAISKLMNKKTIIVTGGFGVIGLALSKNLLNQGHNVVLADNKTNQAKLFKDKRSNLLVIKTNLNKENEIRKTIRLSLKKFNQIDTLVHCAYPKTKDWGKTLKNLRQESLNKNLNNQLGSTIILSKIIINQFLKQNSKFDITVFNHGIKQSKI